MKGQEGTGRQNIELADGQVLPGQYAGLGAGAPCRAKRLAGAQVTYIGVRGFARACTLAGDLVGGRGGRAVGQSNRRVG